MRVAHLVPRYPPQIGGVEMAVRSLCDYLHARGFDVLVVSSGGGEGSPIRASVETENGVTVYRRRPLVRLGQFSSLTTGLWRTLVEFAPDVIVSHSLRHPHQYVGWLYARLKRIPILVADYAGTDEALRGGWAGRLVKLVDHGPTRITNRRVAACICMSPDRKEQLAGFGYPYERVVWIPGAWNRSEVLNADPSRFRSKHHLENQRKVAVVVSRAQKLSNSAVMPAIVQSLPALTFFVFGSGYDPASPEWPWLRSPNVKLVGPIDTSQRQDLLDAYAAADIMVHPVPNEAFGIVLVEALGFGVPVIAYRKGGPATILKGEPTFLCDTDNPSEWVEKIASILDARNADSMRRRTLQCASEYEWSLVGQKWESLLRRCVEESRA